MIPTRSQAQDLIKRKKIKVNGLIETKPARLIGEEDQLEIIQENLFVGRGAIKLLGAFDSFQIKTPLTGVAIDGGASTGGFTQVLLDKGIQKIYAIDGGHGQLHPKLISDPRVVNLEGVNLRHPFKLPEQADWVVMDLSFISLRLVIPNVFLWAREGSSWIILFKPQFEMGKDEINNRGIVKDVAKSRQCLDEFVEWLSTIKLSVLNWVSAPISGKKGNQEYFIFCKK